jgi:hypothetical protein
MNTTPGERDVVSALEADLVALAAADADLERDAEVAERTRIERAQVLLRDRMRGARGHVHLLLLGGGRLDGPVTDAGDGWVVVAHVRPGHREATSEHLVRLGAVLTVGGLDGASPRQPSPLATRPITAVLRAWCRDRSDVTVMLVDATTVHGRASATYGDHLDVVSGEGRTVCVPVGALAAVERARLG